MRHTALRFCALIVFLAAPAQTQPVARQPLPMLEAEACTITYTKAARGVAHFGGRAVYKVTVDKDGSVATMEVVQRNFEGWIELAELENCVRRWRFGTAGVHTLTLFAGTQVVPAIWAQQGQQSFRLRLPPLFR